MRRLVAALMLGAGLILAGCGAAPSPGGDPATAAGSGAAGASASLQAIIDWKATFVPPTTIRPSILAPPPLSDAPILTLRELPNGPSCDYDPALLVPSLAVYGDGRVIAPATQAIGFYCDEVPSFRTGHADVVALRAAVEAYLNSGAPAIDISKSENVADGGLTRLEYTAADGRRSSITADALEYHGQLTEKEAARVALRKVIATITRLARTGAGKWEPSRVLVVTTNPATNGDDVVAPWPVPVTPELRRLLAGGHQGCTTVTGPAATTLLAAARKKPTVASPWTIEGKRQLLAIGVTLDGLRTCAPVTEGR